MLLQDSYLMSPFQLSFSFFLVSMTCSSDPPFARVHVHSSASTSPPREPLRSDSPDTVTAKVLGLKATFTSFFVAFFSNLKVTWTSSPCWLHEYPFSSFSLPPC